MADFKIDRVSAAAPRAWSFKDKRTGADVPMETYKVMLEGVDDPIEINKKPGNAPQVGDQLFGTIDKTEYGLKFKAENKPYTPRPSRGGYEKDQGIITAQWAIGQAVGLFTSGKDENINDIEKNALDFYAMAMRVKANGVNVLAEKKSDDHPQTYKQWASPAVNNTPAVFADGTPVPELPDPFDQDEKFNLDDIPF